MVSEMTAVASWKQSPLAVPAAGAMLVICSSLSQSHNGHLVPWIYETLPLPASPPCFTWVRHSHSPSVATRPQPGGTVLRSPSTKQTPHCHFTLQISPTEIWSVINLVGRETIFWFEREEDLGTPWPAHQIGNSGLTICRQSWWVVMLMMIWQLRNQTWAARKERNFTVREFPPLSH